MKTVFIIAGFDTQHTAATNKYSVLENALKAKNLRTVPVDISWRYKMPLKFVEEFKHFYAKHKGEENIIIGNSFGAVVAFVAASSLKPDLLILGSLSPFFKEDRGKRPDTYGLKYFGKRRMEELWSISAKNSAENINKSNIKTIIAYGQKEYQTSPLLVERCQETAKDIKDTLLIELPNSPHNMRDETYSREIANLV